MAYKFQLGNARLSGSIVQEGKIEAVGNADDGSDISGSSELEIVGAARFGSTVAASGSITAGTSFIIGSADLNETDMEKLDGITNGTVAASKAVVVDSDKDISGFRNVTATGAFIIGSANLNEQDMELIDGLTAGTVAASKAVTVDSDSDVSGFRNVTATGAFIIGSANLNEADMEQIDGITAGTVAASKAIVVDASKDFSGHRNMSGSGVLQNVGNAIFGGNVNVSGAATLNAISGSGALEMVGGVIFGSTLAVSGAATMNSISGSGALEMVGNVIFGGSLDVSGAVKLDGVSDTALAVANDSFYFRDNDDGTMKRDTVADVISNIAGDGLAASSGVLAVGVDDTGIEINSDALRLKDNGVTLAKMAGLTSANFIIGDASNDPSAVTMSGDATMANNGAVTLAAAQTNITSLLATDIKIGEDDETKIDFETANEIKFYANNNQEMVIDDNGVVIAGNLTVQGTTTSVNSTTINISSSFTFEGPADAHETVLSCGSPSADTTLELFQGNAGTYFIPVLSDNSGKSTVIAATVTELNIMDGGNARSAVTIVDGDGFVFNDGGTMKQITASSLKSYVGGSTNITAIDDGETLVVGFNYFDNSHGGAESVTLPASPDVGQIVQVKVSADCSATNKVTVNRAGSQTIDGEVAVILESPNAAVSFVYVANDLWKIY